ncbi:Micro-fibrillar-associated protein 1 C-terminal domain-containing protein [Abortiporus biennis]
MSSRKPAPRLARPAARYWKGKAPKGVSDLPGSSDEDEDQDQDEQYQPEEAGDEQIIEIAEENEEVNELEVRKKVVGGVGKGATAVKVSLKDVSVSKEGRVLVGGKLEVGRTEVEKIEEEEESEEEEEEEEEEEDEDESSEEESSEEEEVKKPMFRPVFIPKRARATIEERAAIAEDTEEAIKKKEAEAEERRRESHNMVAESIRRELMEKEKEAEVPDVDDTDGLDPTAEFEAWRLRELSRIKRDKEAELAREKEKEEIERRRALPEEQRLKEDMERAEKLRAEKPKGQQKFLQKYWHKGAFHQDEEILKRHDFTEATESTVDVSLLPKVMQVKNFGKRGRTKYTHLLDQDTTAGNGGFGGSGSVKSGGFGTGTGEAGGGCFLCGGPHLKKDCPQNLNRDVPPGKLGAGSGANAQATTSSRWGQQREDRPAKGSWRDNERDEDRRRPPRYDDRDGDRYDRRDRDRDRSRDRRRSKERYDNGRGRDRYHDDRDGASEGDQENEKKGSTREMTGWINGEGLRHNTNFYCSNIIRPAFLCRRPCTMICIAHTFDNSYS